LAPGIVRSKDVIKVEIDADNHFYQRNKVSDTFGAELH